MAKRKVQGKPNWERLRLLIRTGLGSLPNMTVDDGDVLVLDGYGICIVWSDDGKYTVQRIDIIRGVRYTRNGDGWPDEEKYTDLKTFNKDSLANIARYVCKTITFSLIDERINGLLEEEEEQRRSADWEATEL